MFNKVLIANRGEIALRIIRACRELGISTVAVYSEADRDSLHVRFADEAICIGPAPPRESYLNIPRIISAAEISNANGIHPGYGFLAENAHFAEICESSGIKFIGPSSSVINRMGDKIAAKTTMKKAGVPVIPGSNGNLSTPDDAKQLAEEFGYPVILKAASGGGGRGMRVVDSADALEEAFWTARSESEAAFGSGALYLEKYFQNPRHIEIQVFADDHGNTVYMGERECSIQRRHQKLIEESPSPVVSDALRKKMGEISVAGMEAIGYVNAGTIEYLLDTDGHFYFMEMNTRIQVEHTVTEMVLDIDLVKEQLRIAAGLALSTAQEDIVPKRHAIECRINAEDSEQEFRPSPGQITSLHIPGGPGIRIDSHVYAQYVIPPYYDSLLAKAITSGKTREEALGRMERTLEELVFEGVKTTIPFHQKVLRHARFRSGQYHTGFIEEEMSNESTG